MEDNDASPEGAAAWWMDDYEETWAEWIPKDITEKVLDAR